MKPEEKEFQEFDRHFPKSISRDIKDYVTNDVLLHSRYIFIRRVARVQFGYCTHCQKRYKTATTLKHNDTATCPKCHSKCVVKNHGTSRKYLYDNGFVVYYEKSRIAPEQAIIARAFKVRRDYSGDYTQVETRYIPLAKYLFVPGNPGHATMYENYYWRNEDSWHKYKSVYSLESKSMYANNCCNVDSIKRAVAGTPFQYSTWDQHDQPQCDYVKFFALYSKCPSVEYLTKLGFGCFVSAKLFDRKTFNCINWRGKRINSILRLSTQDVKEVQKIAKDVNPLHLRLFQLSRKDNNRPTMQEIVSFFTERIDVMTDVNRILRHANLGQIMSYVKKQLSRRTKKVYSDYASILTTWRDYIRDCADLEYDLGNDLYLFPKDLHEAHQQTIKLIKFKADEILDQKIQKRVKELSRFAFEYGELMIRPAESTQELIQEGKKLEHCVGRYAAGHAKGSSSIFLIRRISEPDKPFYTMKIRDDYIAQTRGYKNRPATDEVAQFVDEFKKAKLKVKPNQRTVRKGVAI